MQDKTLDVLNSVSQVIFDRRGSNILVLDVREISTMTDYFLIAEGNVDRHVKSMSIAIKDALEELHIRPHSIEGDLFADWIVMDYSDFIIHLFIPEMREKYALEELWRDGIIVDLNIDTTVKA